jgi:translation initiation factor IF-3
MVGVLQIEEALKIARRAELDLVEISPTAEPPVCKIMNFNKYKYEAKKRLSEAKKKQKVSALKEIKLRPFIGHGDLMTKIKNIKNFLNDGDKVKILLSFRGREITHKEIGDKVLDTIIQEIGEENFRFDVPPKSQGNNLFMIICSSKQ